jgi:hypothetical protein
MPLTALLFRGAGANSMGGPMTGGGGCWIDCAGGNRAAGGDCPRPSPDARTDASNANTGRRKQCKRVATVIVRFFPPKSRQIQAKTPAGGPSSAATAAAKEPPSPV